MNWSPLHVTACHRMPLHAIAAFTSLRPTETHNKWEKAESLCR